MERICNNSFFRVGADELAVRLLGKALCRRFDDGSIERYFITETECYMGQNDSACHAFRGKTPRCSVLWEEGGTLYVHLIYGLHYMLNIVAGAENEPVGVLIRGAKNPEKTLKGPGLLTKQLQIDSSFNRKHITACENFWLEDSGTTPRYICKKRVGIDYATPLDIAKLWRFIVVN